MKTRSYRKDHARPDALTPRAHLILSIEGERPTVGSSRHRIDGAFEVHIGRGDARSALRSVDSRGERLALTVPDSHMSGAHARLTREAAGWRVDDLGSKNGVFVNGARATRASLADADVIRLGQTVFLFRPLLATTLESPADLNAPAHEPALSTLIPSLAQQFDALTRISGGAIPVLLLGETGTGKEVVARAVHALSGRSGPLVAVNCGALPTNLVESELFGHKRGAFSGALDDQPGLFRAAAHGTLLLDEIGELPLPAQAALLRVLQEGEVRPIGGTQAVKVDVRIVAATHRDLDAQVARGAFREDLLARLSGFSLLLPPLRARMEDIGILTSALLRRSSGGGVSLSASACEALLAYDWPRNVRELERALARAALLAPSGVIEAEHLGIDPTETAAPVSVSREGLAASLEKHAGNVTTVAKQFATSRSQIHRWLSRYDLDPKDFRAAAKRE